jgi:cytochrome c556
MRKFSLAITLVAAMAAVILSPTAGHAKAKKEAYEGPHGVFHQRAAKKLTTDKARITLYRRKVMRAMSGHYRALDAIIRQKAPFQSSLVLHVDALESLAKTVPGLFVKGTAMKAGKWGAKAEIWSEPAKFKKHLDGLAASATALRAAVKGNNQADISAKFTLMRHECLACHKVFRIRKPKKKK